MTGKSRHLARAACASASERVTTSEWYKHGRPLTGGRGVGRIARSEHSGRAVGGTAGLRERAVLGGRREGCSVPPCDFLSGWSTGCICRFRDGSSASSTPPRRAWSVRAVDLRVGDGGAARRAVERDTDRSPLAAALGEGQKKASRSCRRQRFKNAYAGDSMNTAPEETKCWLHSVQCLMPRSESCKNKAQRSSLFARARSPLASSGSAGETACSRSTGTRVPARRVTVKSCGREISLRRRRTRLRCRCRMLRSSSRRSSLVACRR
jgi:hypothetical protein